MLFAVAGEVDWETVVAQMQAPCDSWSGPAALRAEERPEPAASIALEHQEGKQEHLALMSPFPNYTDPDYYAAQVVGEALGGNMASRLFVEVREKRGLVYSVSAGLASNRHIGAMRVYAVTTPEQGRERLKVLVAELRKIEHAS